MGVWWCLVWGGLGDGSARVRRICASVVSALVSSWGVHSWPELVPSLLGCLREANPDVALGAFACLKEVLEDNAALFSRDPLGPAKSILTGVMPLCSHPDARIRTQAIGCLTLFSEYSVDVLGDLEPLYLLFIHLSNDVSIEVKRRVVVGFSILMENMNYELSSKYLVKIISIIINYINQSNEELVLEAMEFWTVLLEHLQTDTENLIAQLLPQILPAIFIRMQYSQKDVQEIALQKKTDDYYQESHWNVRKSAAYAFEVFSGRFAGLVPSVLVPMALQGVNSEEWVVREGAVLALGSVASSLQSCCPDFIAGFFPVLLKLLGDEHHLIRVITCWTLGRYSYWAKKNPNFLKQLVNSIINHMNDSNYFVQKASTTAIGEVFVEAFWELLQYSDLLNHILASFTHALQVYPEKSLLCLYYSLNNIAQHSGSEALRNHLIPIYSLVFQKLQHFGDSDPSLFPLLECLTNLIQVVETQTILPHTQFLITRCISWMERSFLVENHEDSVEHQFLVCSMELISAFCNSLNEHPQFLPFLLSTQILNLLHFLTTIENLFSIYSIKTAWYNLVYSLSSYLFESNAEMKDSISQFIYNILGIILLDFKTTESDDIYVTSVQLLGNIISNMNIELWGSYSEEICWHLDWSNPEYQGPCSKTLCLLGKCFPSVVAPRLPEILPQIITVLRSLHDSPHKEILLTGLFQSIICGVGLVGDNLECICEIISTVPQPSENLYQLFGQTLQYLMQLPSWKNLSLPEHIQKNLNSIFNTYLL